MIRKTRQREAVLQVIRDSIRPLTPVEVHQMALQAYPALGLRTVYRHIKDLLEGGEITGIDYPGQPLRYEVVDNRGSRPHFICRGCKALYDLPVDEPKVEYPVLEDFQIDAHEVVFFGLCGNCMKKAVSKKTKGKK